MAFRPYSTAIYHGTGLTECTGVKFQVTYDLVAQLKKGQVTEIPAQVPLYAFVPKEQLQGMFAIFGLWFEQGLFDMRPKDSDTNLTALFPEVKPLTVEGMLQTLYG